MLTKIDQGIIAVATRFSHRFQRLTGLTNYFFAKIGIFMMMLDMIMHVVNYFVPILYEKTSPLLVLILVYLALSFTRKLNILNNAETSLELQSNPTKPFASLPFFRFIFWLLIVVDIYMLPHHISHSIKPDFVALEVISNIFFTFGFLIFCYFVEVTPLPPGKSKIKQWFKGLFATHHREPIPVPVRR